MTRHTEALLSLSKLISPAFNDINRCREIVFSESTPWYEMIDFANQHLLIPSLYSVLEHKELLSLVEDELIVEYLTTVYEFNRKRNEAIIMQLQDLCRLLSEIGVKPVLLKGAAALSEEYFYHVGARVMYDIDILVPESEILKCIEYLASQGGYKPVDSEAPEWMSHQYRSIYTENGIAAVELHRHALIKKCYAYLPDDELMKHVRPSKTIKNAFVLEPTYDLYHIFLHSELQDSCHEKRTLALRGLHHAAVIATLCRDEMQWDTLATMIERHGLDTIWGDYLYMLKRLFELEIPSEMPGSQKHFQEIVDSIEENNTKEPKAFLYYCKRFKEALSYKTLKESYDLQNRAAYPFAVIQSLFSMIFKYTFSSEARKKLAKQHEHHKKSKKFGQ